MPKRSKWDILHRQQKAQKAEYTDQMQLARPDPMPNDIVGRLVARHIEMEPRRENAWRQEWRHVFNCFHISPRLSDWLQANGIDEERISNAVKGTIGSIGYLSFKDDAKQSQLLASKPMLFFEFNAKVSRAVEELGAENMAVLNLPKELKDWVLKFRRPS